MTDKLLPCPFCGGKARIMLEEEDRPDDSFHNVYCTECGVQIWVKSKTEAIAAWNRRAQLENEPLVRCENCTHWDKSIPFMMSAHACSYWSPSKSNPRYTAGFEFCSFAKAKPERSEG